MTQPKKSVKMTIRDMAFIGVMAAVVVVCKEAMSFLPNIEPVSFWIILFTLFFGWKVFFVILVFILVEGCLYGMGLWWVMYFYAWPLLSLLTYLNRKQESVWFWSTLSGFFGLFFGFLCAIPYGIIGMASGGIGAGMRTAFAWWVAGIQWDVAHCIGNFAVMFILYRPMCRVMKRYRSNRAFS